MTRFAAILSLLLACVPSNVLAQSSPNWSRGYVPSAGEINNAFAKKQDRLQYTPLSQAGGTMTGQIRTAPSTINSAGLTITPGIAPIAPTNGDIWSTSVGLYNRVGSRTLAIPGLDQSSGVLLVPGGPTLGTYQNGQFAATFGSLSVAGTATASQLGVSVAAPNGTAWARVTNTAIDANALAAFQMVTGNSALIWQIFARAGIFTIGISGVADYFKIDGSGNVGIGIGTAAPAAKLDVAGTIRGPQISLTGYTVAGLPACSASAKGTVTMATDVSAAPTYRQTGLSGGGSVAVPVFCNGSAWEAH